MSNGKINIDRGDLDDIARWSFDNLTGDLWEESQILRQVSAGQLERIVAREPLADEAALTSADMIERADRVRHLMEQLRAVADTCEAAAAALREQSTGRTCRPSVIPAFDDLRARVAAVEALAVRDLSDAADLVFTHPEHGETLTARATSARYCAALLNSAADTYEVAARGVSDGFAG